MLPPVGVESRTFGFHVLHAAILANSLLTGRLKPLDPYIAMLYWFLEVFGINKAWLYKYLKVWDF